MAGAVAAVACAGPVTIEGFAAVSVSWPGFARVLEGLWS
jgi:5-enolpyruvylshikimate-3-phosphate synthase